MTTGFWDVDTQRDFLDPGGALPVKGAQEIMPNLRLLYAAASERVIPLVASACAHRKDDEELRSFPPHCLEGTPGAERFARAEKARELFVSPDSPLPSGIPDAFRRGIHVVLQKRQLDVFTNPHADAVLAAADADRWVVFGVCTDCCVKDAVLGLLRRGRDVVALSDAIRGLDPAASETWIDRMKKQGARFRTTREVLSSLPRSAGTLKGSQR